MSVPQGSNAEQSVRQPRRRHVVSRDRNGCFTCRRRHLRCDKAKPHCDSCRTANLICEGYGNKIAFKDQTLFVTQRFSGRDEGPKRRRHQPPPPPEEEEEDTSAKAVSLQLEPMNGPITRSGPEFPDLFFDEYATGLVQQHDNTTMLSPIVDDPFWQDWPLTELLHTDGRQLQLYGASPSLLDSGSSPADSTALAAMDTGLVSQIMNPRIAPSPAVFSDQISKCFLFPEDASYYRRLLDGQVRGLATILPIRDFIIDEGLSAPYLYNAALAVSALTLSWIDTRPSTRKHALRHYAVALNSLRDAFPESSNPRSFQGAGLNELLSWLLARLLLANFDLSWGSLAAWRAHLRAAGRVLSAWHGRITRGPPSPSPSPASAAPGAAAATAGRKLVQAFARMALLVELQNEERAVTRLRTMNPAVAGELSALLERSEAPRDRLLHLIREVTRLEVRCRAQPGLGTRWALEMGALEARLAAWQRSLPASELPVDTGVQDPIAFSSSFSSAADHDHLLACAPVVASGGGGGASLLQITPLTFPNSADAYTAAVNYAHFLCARMRARTRYLEGETSGARVTPPDTEATVLHICRIAAGMAPAGCAQADAFGHGMMPAVFGAHRWTANTRIQAWIKGWLGGYPGPGREGIWNVGQTRRLLHWLDAERARRRKTERDWDIIAARIEEEDDDEDDVLDGREHGVWEKVVRRVSESESSSDEGFELAGRGEILDTSSSQTTPFRVIIHSKMSGGWTTDYCVVP